MLSANEVLTDVLEPEEHRVQQYQNEVIRDFWICCVSREVSLLGRKEVLTGKAKFGILGDGKEVPQVALARAFKQGDWRAGYYRDQTLMFALGLCTVEDFFAQLYSDTENDPFSGGRQMNAHFATPTIDAHNAWLKHVDNYNISADISCTGGQMARGLGLAFASKLYRALDEAANGFSSDGNEIAFVTIGDASTSEGVFWESVNAATVSKVPMAIAVWDDGYGISVPKKYQTAKSSISEALKGMEYKKDKGGMFIFKAKAYDYPGLVRVFIEGSKRIRDHHIPGLFHIEDCTQPQGHSTSGSHERYKSKARLQWEKEYDCIDQMAKWMVEAGICDAEKITSIRTRAVIFAKEGRDKAWNAYRAQITPLKRALTDLIDQLPTGHAAFTKWINEFKSSPNPSIAELIHIARQLHLACLNQNLPIAAQFNTVYRSSFDKAEKAYSSELYIEGPGSVMQVAEIPAEYRGAEEMNGYQVLNKYFDLTFQSNAHVIAFGEDVGHIGDVNQGLAGMQEKYGKHRVFDTGIREWTIIGQAIGAAMRGLRPIAEIQYLDYLMYGLEPLSDDVATLRYRTNGTQACPLIIRTRGHRLEGIWHAGSPMGVMLHSLRGMYIGVPRNMVQAAGMYNTLLSAQEPGIIVECLNGYRLKEQCPSNLSSFTVPFGKVDVLQEGTDLTVLSYGSTLREVQKALDIIEQWDISVELIDAQSLLPFDVHGDVGQSVKKTSRLLIVDEDVPGGASAYLLQQIMERQGAYFSLDSAAETLTAKSHRPAYGSDGDYFSKPSVDDIVQKIMNIMHEVEPSKYPFVD